MKYLDEYRDPAKVKSLLREIESIVTQDWVVMEICGGLATSLVEISKQSNVLIEINEESLPMKLSVNAACEVLGFDPMFVANEGKLVAFVKESDASKILDVMKKTKYGDDAAIIGKVIGTEKSQVRLKTAIG